MIKIIWKLSIEIENFILGEHNLNIVSKDYAKFQFKFWTETLGLEHTFSFDEAYKWMEYNRDRSLIEHKKLSYEKQIAKLNSNYPSKEKFRNWIDRIEKNIINSPNGKTGEEMEKANPLKHSFADGLYIREVFNPKGELLTTRIHKVKHPFFLLKGDMTIFDEREVKRLRAPYYGITSIGTKRLIYAHEDCIFVTVHYVGDNKNIESIEDDIASWTYQDFNKWEGKL